MAPTVRCPVRDRARVCLGPPRGWTTGAPSRGAAIPLERAPVRTPAADLGVSVGPPFTALLASSTTAFWPHSARSDQVTGIPVSNPSE